VFFWSEEEARAHRRTAPVDGLYFTMRQASYVTRVGQASLFDIDMASKIPRRC
jgi:hypothetical protein